ncbi:hypothetical protein NW762_009136 [Fusarium torreyae]|uniref:Uncharacterized protein n=1 Tax=Fusarium torreyae TaxID=1237075 RepID=A0A9W8RTZ2_9HYPO|nr:hypothetical protein NW762_009136 [Fusarium torreyae]
MSFYRDPGSVFSDEQRAYKTCYSTYRKFEGPSNNRIQWLSLAVDDVFTYDPNATDMAHMGYLEQTGQYAEKGVFDYTYELQRCYESGASYVGMFENDIILAHGWLIKTLRGLREITSSDENYQDWLSMRLLNLEGLIGWVSHDIGGNNESCLIFGIGL